MDVCSINSYVKRKMYFIVITLFNLGEFNFNRTFRKSIGSAVLLAILLFSFTAYLTPFVQADRIGVGKFVEIDVIGEGGYVILTKVSSGETWDTRDLEDGSLYSLYEKVGAGLVTVIPIAETGYVFDHWIVDDVPENTALYLEFRTSKGITEIEAFFTKIGYTVTVSVFKNDEHPAGGTIKINDNPIESDYFAIPLGLGETIDIEFIPSGTNHISALSVENLYVIPELQIVADDRGKDYSIVVFFSSPGSAYVPNGFTGVTYFSQDAGLQFEEATGGVDANGIPLVFPTEWATFLWDIFTEATDGGDGNVTIVLKFDGIVPLSAVYRSDKIEELYCDVNNDGVLDGTDNSLVAQAIKTYEQGTIGDYDPLYDVNQDLDLNEADLHFLHNYYGTILDSLEFTSEYDVNTDITTISIETDHFSIFRGR